MQPDGYAHLRGGTLEGSASSGRSRTIVAIVEIDRFLLLRARVGYTRANTLMRILTKRVIDALPAADVGRVGRSSIELTMAVAPGAAVEDKLMGAALTLEHTISVDGLDFNVTGTIGAVDIGTEAVSDGAIDLAASAVADAQRSNERIRLLDAGRTISHSIDDLTLIADMPGAMRSGALQVHYQPKMRLRTNVIDSAEALIRWDHPKFGQIPIEHFVRLVEETGAIRRLSEWVIARAVMDCATLAACGHHLTIWVNLSGLLLADGAFTQHALGLIEGHQGSIGFEITETAVIGDPVRAMANLDAFRAAGVKIAIDDYGSGLSSLAYLKQLPAQELKIDRMFIRELVDSHRDPLLVRSSIDLAHALDMEVTAEGVDDPMALALLRTMGCDLVQGYLLSPALPLGSFTAMLSDHDRLARLTSVNTQAHWISVAASRDSKRA